jgi:DNA-3-methyladenine glycosylase
MREGAIKKSTNWLELLNSIEQVAARLLGSEIVRKINGQRIVVRIVETEAYDQTDAASHSYRGPTPRTKVMFGPPGYAYVYFTYGMHYCMNVVTGPIGHGSAVLIRAAEPVAGIEAIRAHRPKTVSDRDLTNGPAKLCQALMIDKTLSGHDLRVPPLQLILKPALPKHHIVTTTRIGISREQELPLRFYIQDNSFVSRKA